MAEESFPFQELADGDRTVSAAMFAKHIGMIRSRGVIKSVDNGLAVSQSSPAAMSVDLDTGAAFAGATQLRAYRNTLARTITIAAADPTDPRHDLVVLDMNTDTGPPDTRRVTTMIVQGTPDPSPSDPALVQTETHYQLALARVLVGAAVASIVDANITDLRTYSTPLNAPTGGLTREGGNTTEATTTSTSAVDLVSITSLSVATGSPIDARGLARKSGGAASNGGIGLKINATVVSEANATAGHGGAVWTGSTNADRAEAGPSMLSGLSPRRITPLPRRSRRSALRTPCRNSSTRRLILLAQRPSGPSRRSPRSSSARSAATHRSLWDSMKSISTAWR